MKCSACQHENDTGAKFCEECGAKLVRICSGCGSELKPTAKFCPECGQAEGAPQATSPTTPRTAVDYTPQHLAERIRAEQQAMESRGTADGERYSR